MEHSLPAGLTRLLGKAPCVYENFYKIPKEEQDRILTGCIEEFARNGYDKASTNAIVKKANIPKGTLFYYFGSKKDLYLFILDHAVERFTKDMNQALTDLPSDLFERLFYLGEMRMQWMLREPMLYQLFFNVFVLTPDEIKVELQQRFAGYYSTSTQMLYQGLDLAKFKENIVVEEAIDLTYLVLEGLYGRYAAMLKQTQPLESLALVRRMTEECRVYFQLLAKGIYKSPD
jgi:TetR/AcrR family transcriptional regulator